MPKKAPHLKKTQDMKAYQKEWERKNRSCKARGVKHSGIGKQACWSDIHVIKGLEIKKAEPGKPFIVDFD